MLRCAWCPVVRTSFMPCSQKRKQTGGHTGPGRHSHVSQPLLSTTFPLGHGSMQSATQPQALSWNKPLRTILMMRPLFQSV